MEERVDVAKLDAKIKNAADLDYIVNPKNFIDILGVEGEKDIRMLEAAVKLTPLAIHSKSILIMVLTILLTGVGFMVRIYLILNSGNATIV